jgi:hypothetical protein
LWNRELRNAVMSSYGEPVARRCSIFERHPGPFDLLAVKNFISVHIIIVSDLSVMRI